MRSEGLALLSLLCVACGDIFDDEQGRTGRTTLAYAINTSVARPSEEPLLAIAQKAESFAGYYCEDGDLFVGTTAPLGTPEAKLVASLVEATAVASLCYNRSFPAKVPQVLLVNKKYNFLSLRTFRDTIVDDFFEIDGANSVGIDYVNNRLRLAVEPLKRAHAEALAASYQLPADLHTIVEEPLPTLQVACPNPSNGPDIDIDCFRPIPAGTVIETAGQAGSPVYYKCTIGSANDRYIPGNGWLPGFVTNSHCLPPQLINSGDYVYQPYAAAEHFVAFEFVDPPGWSCGGYTCRYSDAAWMWHYQGGVQHGTITQTLGWSGSKTISSTHPRFYIWGSTSGPQGTQVDKVGRTTGWTMGLISAVCVDQVAPSGIKLVCQDKATYSASGGDSGAPVFYWWWFYGVDTVELMGIHWGRIGNDAIYSPWDNIALELGDIYIQYPYF